MSFSKQYGPVTLSESAGNFSAVFSTTTGVNFLFDMLSAKFPSLSTEIAAFKALVDAEISKA